MPGRRANARGRQRGRCGAPGGGGAEPPPRRSREVLPPRPDAGSGAVSAGNTGCAVLPRGALPILGSISPGFTLLGQRRGAGAAAEGCGEGAQQLRGAGELRGLRWVALEPGSHLHCALRPLFGSVKLGPCPWCQAEVWVSGQPRLILGVDADCYCHGVVEAVGHPAGKTAGDFCSCCAEFNNLRSGCLAVVMLLGGAKQNGVT